MMPLTRRHLLRDMAAAAATGLASGVLAACGATPAPAATPVQQTGATPAPEATVPAQTSEQFVLEQLESWADDYKKYTDEVIYPQLHEKWPNVTVNEVPIDWGTLEEKLMTSAAAGTMPDVYRTAADWVTVAEKVSLPMNDLVQAWGQKDDFYAGAWVITLHGNVWGIPQLTGPRHYCYRKDLTDAEGVTITDDWDWDEYMETAVKMTKFEGNKVVRKGSSTDIATWEYILVSTSAGVEFVKDGKAGFASEEGIWALDWMVKRNNAVAPQGFAPLQSMEIPYFAMGLEVIEYAHPGVHAKDVEKYAPDKLQYVTVPQPPLKAKRVAMVDTDGLAVGKTSKHIEAAFDLIALHCGTEATAEYNRGVGLLPPRKSAVAAASYIADSPVMKQVAEHLDQFGVAYPVWPERIKLMTFLDDELKAAELGQKTPEEALISAAKEWDTTLAANNWQE
ncbi:MAG: extracellular solute-binding protein [Anaerolineae bacterium]